jgi:hypothetical protein
MPISISDNFNIQIGEPIDTRLTTDTTQSRDASQLGNYYEGLITFVKENGLLYVLINTGSGTNLSAPLSNSPGYAWKQIATTDMVFGGGVGGNGFATMSIGGVNVLADSPSGSVFIASGSFGGIPNTNNNLLISASEGNDTITFSLVDSPTFTHITASGNISSSGDLFVTGTSTLTGNSTIGGTLGVTGLLSANGAITTTTITASGNISSSGDLFVTGTSTLTGNSTIGGTLGVTGLLSANGAITTTNITASGNISSSLGLIGQTLTINGGATIGQLLTANDVRIPNTLVVSGSTILGNASTNDDTLTINSPTSIKDNLDITGSLFVNGNSKLGSDFTNHNVTVESKQIFSLGAASGFTGTGWMITRNDGNGITTLDIDNINIRGTLSATTFLAQQIRATNGSVYVSSTGRVNSTSSLGLDSSNSQSFGLVFETGSGIDGHGFQSGDVIRAQRTSATNTSTTQYKSDMIVRSVPSNSILTASLMSGSSEPQFGYDYVRLGNTASISIRRGTVYLTSDDSNAPYIDVVDGVQSHQDWENGSKVKVRMGNLAGMTSQTFGGALSGYGLYASGSAYLEGGINATVGLIAGWNISSSKIEKRNIELNSNESFARFGDGVTLTQNNGVFLSGSGEIMIGDANGKRISFINGDLIISSSNFTLLNGNITASNATLSGKITANEGAIGGWDITSTAITKSGIELNSADTFFKAGTIASNLSSGTGILLSGSGEAVIGNPTGHRISFINNDLVISASNATLKGDTVEISGSNFHLLNGNITASNATLSGTITANAGKIGGFAITQDAITGSGFFLSGSATGDGFFISASNFNVKANGQITASRVLFTGGKVGGFNLSSDAISGDGFFLSGSATGDGFFISASNFNVKANGQITASRVLFTGGSFVGGTIGGFTLSSDAISGAGFFLSGSATGDGFFISASNFNVKANGTITASNATLSGTITATAGVIGGWRITDSQISSSGIILATSSAEDGTAAILMGQAIKLDTGSGVFLNGTGFFRVGNPNGKRIRWDNDDLIISSSNFTLLNGNITASNVRLSGTITASAGLIGGFNTTTNAINTTSSIISASVDFGPHISLRANGQITGSDVLLRRLQSDGNVYTHFDTSTGIIDVRNVGRQIVQDYNGMTIVGGSNNVWYESSDCYYPIHFLEGENALLISFSMLGQTGNGTTPEHYAKITLSSASVGGLSPFAGEDASMFDTWGGEIEILETTFTSNGIRSQVIIPSGSLGGVKSIPESYQGKYCLLKLQLKHATTAGTTTTTAVRGLTITATRTFAANTAIGTGFIQYKQPYQ